jgi:hypothetical protein
MGIFLVKRGSAKLVVSADQATGHGARFDRLGDPMLSERTVFFGALDSDGASNLFDVFEGKINQFLPMETPASTVAYERGASRHTIETTSVSVNQRGRIAYLGSP